MVPMARDKGRFGECRKLSPLLIFIFLAIIYNIFFCPQAIAQNNATKSNANSMTTTLQPVYAVILSVGIVTAITAFIAWLIGRVREGEEQEEDINRYKVGNESESKIAEELSSQSDDQELQKTDKTENKLYSYSFWDIIREGDYYPSLARFQFLLWTFVIAFTFLLIYIFRLCAGETTLLPVLSNSSLELLGISAASPIIGNIISRLKYDRTIFRRPYQKQIQPFSTMFLEGKKPVLYRYQLFLWTFIGLGVYLFMTFSMILENVPITNFELVVTTTEGKLLSLNDVGVDPTIVAITAISQGGYLGGKFASRTPLRIRDIFGNEDGTILYVFGENFGVEEERGTILIDRKVISNEDIKTWSDSKIRLESKGKNPTTNHDISVVTNEGIYATKKYEGKVATNSNQANG